MLTVQVRRTTEDILSEVTQGMAPLTKESYRHSIVKFLTFAIRSKQQDPYQNAYEAFQAWRTALDKDYAPATTNKMLSAVRSFFKLAMAKGLITYEQHEAIKLIPNVRDRGRKFQKWAPHDEVKDILTSMDTSTNKGKRDKLLFFLLAGLGLRREETVTLKWSQLQRVDNMWLLVDVVGKGSKVRTVHVPTEYIPLFNDFRQGAADNEHILVSVNKGDNKGTSLSTTAVNKIVSQHTDLSPHAFRRFFATRSKEMGAPIGVIQNSLGHATEHTTQIYLNKAEQHKHSVYEYGDVI